ncbi:MAG: hypothetical protein OXH52_06960 [Gammaproteobacteria bacterium]|nr:hypothetical protein [Gammaproteobacteria bacterium]
MGIQAAAPPLTQWVVAVFNPAIGFGHHPMGGTNGSLLAHLASRLTGRTETLATEALGYILSRSPGARSALRELVGTGADDVGVIESVETEVKGDANERVDLVGFDAQGFERVLVEAKFWAGLTEHQPKTYLERLRREGHAPRASVLLFVAPEQRLETLWNEVRGRVPEGMLDDGEPRQVEQRYCARIRGGPYRLMLTSWARLLRAMSSRASDEGDVAAEGDLQQLLALCEREDSDAFLPIRAEEFGPAVPRRLLNLQQLVDDATERARERGFADTKGLNVTPQTYGYGRYLRLGRADAGWAEAWFGVNYQRWAKEGETPLWLHFVHGGNSPHMSLADLRSRLGGTHFYVPLPVGVEYDSALDAVVKSLGWLAEGLVGEGGAT